MGKNKCAAVILSAVLLASSFAYSPTFGTSTVQAEATEYKHAFDQKVIKRFKAERSMHHIQFLSEQLGPRVAGTKEEEKAASYIKNLLTSYGFDIEVQEFSIPDRLMGTLEANGNKVRVNIPTGADSTDEAGLSGTLYDANLGYPEDFTSEVEGKIALISRGELTFANKIKNATEAGAAGVIIYNNQEGTAPLNMSLGDYQAAVPVAGITKVSGEALLNDVLPSNTEVTLAIERFENSTSQNIIATRTPKHVEDPDILHVTAHYDSVQYAPGANDNASGTSVVLELARILKSYPLDKELRFVFFGAEEIGLVGSDYYVNKLSEEEVKRSIGNFNLDMVGTDWDQATSIYMNTLDGQSNIVSETAVAAAERLDTPSPLTLYQRGASDHVSFYEGGIDSVNFIRREPGSADLEPYYHTPQDILKYISEERLQEIGELIGASVYQIVGNK